MKVLVCGGRDYDDYDMVSCALAEFEFADADYVIQGGASGADALARRWCKVNNVACLTIPAKWSHYGNSAGPLRNKIMAEMRPDVCLAFAGGKGTANMTAICSVAKIPVKAYR